MLMQHVHTPGAFDPGHCQRCAVESGLLAYFSRVQREEAELRRRAPEPRTPAGALPGRCAWPPHPRSS